MLRFASFADAISVKQNRCRLLQHARLMMSKQNLFRQSTFWLYGITALVLSLPRPLHADDATSIDTPLLQSDEAQISLIQNTFIAAPIAGVVAKVDTSEGDVVKVGTSLIQLNAEQAETELLAARSAYEAARLESANDVDERYARRTLEVRQRELEQSQQANLNFLGTVSETEIEKLKLVVDQSALAIEQAEHKRLVASATAAEKQAAVRIAEAKLKKHTISATVSGMVTEIDVQPGEWVEAGKPVVRVISLDPLRAECFVDGREHGSELVGHVVKFYPRTSPAEQAGNQAVDQDAVVTGSVVYVSPELHPVTGQVRLWATIPNPDLKVRSGMQGRLVVTAEQANAAETSPQ
jgi:macrolide-specific efflux system membrane fusion protein